MLRGLDDPNDFDIWKFAENYSQGKGTSKTNNLIFIHFIFWNFIYLFWNFKSDCLNEKNASHNVLKKGKIHF